MKVEVEGRTKWHLCLQTDHRIIITTPTCVLLREVGYFYSQLHNKYIRHFNDIAILGYYDVQRRRGGFQDE